MQANTIKLQKQAYWEAKRVARRAVLPGSAAKREAA